jgi:hypothetical protein
MRKVPLVEIEIFQKKGENKLKCEGTKGGMVENNQFGVVWGVCGFVLNKLS